MSIAFSILFHSKILNYSQQVLRQLNKRLRTYSLVNENPEHEFQDY